MSPTVPEMLKPLTPSAQRAARARAFGPMAPARRGTWAWAGAGPTGSARGNGGSPAHSRRSSATWVSRVACRPAVGPLGRPEVVAPSADTDAHGQSSARQLVEGGQLLGHDRHRVGREHDQVGEQAHPLGDHGCGRERDQPVRVVEGDPLAHRHVVYGPSSIARAQSRVVEAV